MKMRSSPFTHLSSPVPQRNWFYEQPSFGCKKRVTEVYSLKQALLQTYMMTFPNACEVFYSSLILI